LSLNGPREAPIPHQCGYGQVVFLSGCCERHLRVAPPWTTARVSLLRLLVMFLHIATISTPPPPWLTNPAVNLHVSARLPMVMCRTTTYANLWTQKSDFGRVNERWQDRFRVPPTSCTLDSNSTSKPAICCAIIISSPPSSCNAGSIQGCGSGHSLKTDPHAWWKYAIACVMSCPYSRQWHDIERIGKRSGRYIELVSKNNAKPGDCLGFHSGLSTKENAEVLRIEDALPSQALLAFHLVALRRVFEAQHQTARLVPTLGMTPNSGKLKTRSPSRFLRNNTPKSESLSESVLDGMEGRRASPP
jgi:hypothetical protein